MIEKATVWQTNSCFHVYTIGLFHVCYEKVWIYHIYVVYDCHIICFVIVFVIITIFCIIRTLDYLIGKSGARQLYHLSEKLNCLLKRDFLKHLPVEMSFYLLQFLDPESLLACCQVSHKWNKVVNSCLDCWKRACNTIGKREWDSNIEIYIYRYVQYISLSADSTVTVESS